MASGSESAKEEHYHNLTSKQREQILGKNFIFKGRYSSNSVVPKWIDLIFLSGHEIYKFGVTFLHLVLDRVDGHKFIFWVDIAMVPLKYWNTIYGRLKTYHHSFHSDIFVDWIFHSKCQKGMIPMVNSPREGSSKNQKVEATKNLSLGFLKIDLTRRVVIMFLWMVWNRSNRNTR